MVSIHASVKDATAFTMDSRLISVVSIHASVKDATYVPGSAFLKSSCFNPRICKRCDKFSPPLPTIKRVSIHASVKDATVYTSTKTAYICVSIHASVKDATEGQKQKELKEIVSIHASVKDATCHFDNGILNRSFNPRICKRCDL